MMIITTSIFILGFSELYKQSKSNNPQHKKYYKNRHIMLVSSGMTKKQAIDALGQPLFKDQFIKNKWYYILIRRHKQFINESRLVLNFNEKNLLIDMVFLNCI